MYLIKVGFKFQLGCRNIPIKMKLSKLVSILALIFSGCILQPAVGASLSSAEREGLMKYLIQGYLQDIYEEEARAMEDSGIAEIMDASSNRLEGTFMGKDGDGIVFVSEDDGTGRGKLSISTLQGETLFHAVQSQGSHASLVRVGNQAILMHKGNEREDVSLSRIPLTHMSMAETAVAENNKFQTNLLKENLQRISEDEATALLSKIQNDRGYIKNVVEAAHAIASKGITGVENNAARLFFVHAKNLAAKSGYLPSTVLSQ